MPIPIPKDRVPSDNSYWRGSVLVFREDLEIILADLRKVGTVELKDDDFVYESLDDLSRRYPFQTTRLDITVHNKDNPTDVYKSISISIQPSWVHMYWHGPKHDPDFFSTVGNVRAVVADLKSSARRPMRVAIVIGSVAFVLAIAIILSAIPDGKIVSVIVPGIFAVIVWLGFLAWMLCSSLGVGKSRVTHYYRDRYPGWLKRNEGRAVHVAVTAVVSAAVGVVVGQAMSCWFSGEGNTSSAIVESGRARTTSSPVEKGSLEGQLGPSP